MTAPVVTPPEIELPPVTPKSLFGFGLAVALAALVTVFVVRTVGLNATPDVVRPADVAVVDDDDQDDE